MEETRKTQFIGHGLFEYKLSEILYEIWQFRRKVNDWSTLKNYLEAIKSLSLILPIKVKKEIQPFLEEFNQTYRNLKNSSQTNPFKREIEGIISVFNAADKFLEKIVESLDRNNLLVLSKPERLKGEFEGV